MAKSRTKTKRANTTTTPPPAKAAEPLFTGSDWTFETLWKTYDAIEAVAGEMLRLDLYPNQIEIISSEQMLDAYSSVGMPLMYRHWSFGKSFVREERAYRKGLRGLAYEIVINSNPCISYNMEENTMAMQTLVMAHAAFGHNHFFKTNHLFRMWTDADGILDYLDYARRFIAECEERHGEAEVEGVLDAAHALMPNGVFRYDRPSRPSLREEEARHRERLAQEEADVNYLWSTLPAKMSRSRRQRELERRKDELNLPEENIVFFLEQYSPVLPNWKREILRIVRHIAQYFYPQRQTKVMNEGCATFCHYEITNEMHRRGLLSDGAMMEILHQHTNVVFQPGFDDPRYSGINPYALGFAIMSDIKRMVLEPTEEDRDWFPAIAGTQDWVGVLHDVWANYRDESFIQQFLSPRVMRDFRLFSLTDREDRPYYTVSEIHNEPGYREVRAQLAGSYDLAVNEPDIQVVDVDLLGDRRLVLRATSHNGARLAQEDRQRVLHHIEFLWGYDVAFEGEFDDEGDEEDEDEAA